LSIGKGDEAKHISENDCEELKGGNLESHVLVGSASTLRRCNLTYELMKLREFELKGVIQSF
jgi:hypothetical protein